jgi:hypothetical protein
MSRRQNCYNIYYYRGGFDGRRRPSQRNRRKTRVDREGEKKRRIKKQRRDNEPIGRCQTKGTPPRLSHAPGDVPNGNGQQ